MNKHVVVGLFLTLFALPLWAGDMPRLLSTTGQGTVEVDPDIAVMQMAAEAFNVDREKAKQAADRTLDLLIASAKKLGVKEKDIVASSVQVNPRYEYQRETNESKIVGFDARRPVTINLRDLSKIDRMFAAALEAGISQLGAVELKNADPDKHQNAAREAAIADSKAKAEMLAKAYGATLGPIHSIQYHSGMPMIPMMQEKMVGARMMAMDAVMAAPEGQYLHDKVTYHDSIEVVFDLVVE